MPEWTTVPESDRRLRVIAEMVLAPGDLALRLGAALNALHDALDACVGPDGDVVAVDARASLDSHLDTGIRPALIAVDGGGHEPDMITRSRETLLRWRPVVITTADPESLMEAGSTLFELLCALRRPGYVVRAVARFGLRKPDTSIYAEPCHWVAVPCERKELIARISSRIRWSQLLPSWPAFSALTRAVS